MRIRPYAASDAEGVLALNAANQPEVGPLDHIKLASLATQATLFLVLEDERTQALTGMIIVLDEQADYSSPNYRWFCDRYDRFYYVDRIAVAAPATGQGWGSALYHATIEATHASGRRRLCAEVNTIPDNPPSHRFHLGNGFVEVDRTNPYSPDTEVAMYVKDLDEDIPAAPAA